jgi:hypothetical protein
MLPSNPITPFPKKIIIFITPSKNKMPFLYQIKPLSIEALHSLYSWIETERQRLDF